MGEVLLLLPVLGFLAELSCAFGFLAALGEQILLSECEVVDLRCGA